MKAAAKTAPPRQVTPGAHDAIEGFDQVDKVISVDQTPSGGTPTSTPATYSGAFDLIRELFAKLPESKIRGYRPGGSASISPAGGARRARGPGRSGSRCTSCPTSGSVRGLPRPRFTPETLAVKFRGKTIADVLDMNVDAALDLFASVPKIRKVLQTLHDVGLGYVPLGQSAPTLSGGEAQRVKLAAELARPDTGKTLYILDEPTTGLHLDDVRKLLAVVHRLADLGNTVVIIEHNLEVIKTADWVIDIGPEAGLDGGEVVAAGTPEAVSASKRSLTGSILKGVLSAGPVVDRVRFDPKAAAKKAIAELKKLVRPNDPDDEDADGVQPPWETDGRRWHTLDRTSRNGKPARWDGRAWNSSSTPSSPRHVRPDRLVSALLVKVSGPRKNAPVFLTARPATSGF